MPTITAATNVATITATIENLRTVRQFCADTSMRASLTKRMAKLEALKDEAITTTIARAQKRITAMPIAPEGGVNPDPSIQRVPTAPAKDWRGRKPTANQIGRNRSALAQINRMESVLGYRLSTFQALNNGKPCKFTAGAYSDFYQSVLKPMAASLTIEAEVEAA